MDLLSLEGFRNLIKTLSDPKTLMALASPFSPALGRVFLIIIGIALGMILVYLPFPMLGIKFTSGDPVHLTSGYKDQWVKNIAIAHQEGLIDDATAKTYLETAGYDSAKVGELATANQGTPYESALVGVQALPDGAVAETYQAKVQTSLLGTLMPICCVFFLGLLGIVMGIGLSFKPVPIGPWRAGATARDSRTAGLGDVERRRREELAEVTKMQAMAGGAEESELGEPLYSFTSIYTFGNDFFDDSFAVEPDDRFVGECGAGIGEDIGEGSPKKVTAFEVFLFDQAEIKTLTYVLMSEYAYNDPALRDQLAPRGPAVMAQAGSGFTMTTQSMVMKVSVLKAEYGEGALPPNSFFEKVSLGLKVWLREGAEGGSDDFVMPEPILKPLPTPDYGAVPPAPMPMAPQQPMAYPPQQPMPPQAYPPQQPMPPQAYPPQQPLPPQAYPPQQPMAMPPQQPGFPPPPPPGVPPQGGLRPLPPQAPPPAPPGGGFTGRPPGGAPPIPGRQAPPSDDPFGDTHN
jgi:hypothetical protein